MDIMFDLVLGFDIVNDLMCLLVRRGGRYLFNCFLVEVKEISIRWREKVKNIYYFILLVDWLRGLNVFKYWYELFVNEVNFVLFIL